MRSCRVVTYGVSSRRRDGGRRSIPCRCAKYDAYPRSLGLGLLAFVAVRSEEASSDQSIARALADCQEVLEVHHVAGDDCYLIKVRARDAEHLGHLLRTRFGRIPGVRSTRTTIVLETVKETSRLPVPLPVREGIAS